MSSESESLSISLPGTSSSVPATTTRSSTSTTAQSTSSSTSVSSTSTSSSTSSSSSSSSTAESSSSSTTATSVSSSAVSTSAVSTSSSESVIPSTTRVVTTDQGGGVVTITHVVSATASASQTSSSADASASNNKGFFDNKGAVAGVFTVVGLVGLALLILLFTTFLRRRRARNIDRELAEAASAGPAPIYLDDEPDRDMGRSMYSGAAGGYSDLSHGTYNQKPLETYSMSEMGPGAAGVGVQRQRSMGGQQWAPTDNGWAAAGESQNPYPAFAVPGGYQPSQAYDGPNYHPDAYHGGYEDNYGYYGAAAYEQPRERSPPLPPLPTQTPPHEQPAEALNRSRSKSLLNYGQGGATPPTPPTPPAESYAAHYAIPGGSGPSGGNISAGGSQSGHMANPYDDGHVNRDSAGSMASHEDSDDEDDGPQPKVLKVANE